MRPHQPQRRHVITSTSSRKIDYWLTNEAFGPYAVACGIEHDLHIATHRPVWLRLRGIKNEVRIPTLMKHQKLPTEIAIGPQPPEDAARWQTAVQAIQEAHLLAERAIQDPRCVEEAHTATDAAYTAFVDAMEQDIATATHTHLSRPGLRGVKPTIKITAPKQQKHMEVNYKKEMKNLGKFRFLETGANLCCGRKDE